MVCCSFSHLQMRPCLSILFIYKYSQVCCSPFPSHLQMQYHLLILFIYKYSQVCRFPFPSHLQMRLHFLFFSISFTNTARFVIPPCVYRFSFTNAALFINPLHLQIQPGLSFPLLLLFPFTNAVPFIDPLHLQIQPGLSFPLPFPFTNAASFSFLFHLQIPHGLSFHLLLPFTNVAPFDDPSIHICRSPFSFHLQMWYHLLIPITNLFIRPLFIGPLHLQIQPGLSFRLPLPFTKVASFVDPFIHKYSHRQTRHRLLIQTLEAVLLPHLVLHFPSTYISGTQPWPLH